MDISGFANSIEQAMEGTKFRVSRDVELADERKATLAASRTYFSWKGLVLLSQHLFVVHGQKPTVADVHAVFEAGFRHAKKVNRIPLLRGMQFGYMIIPCLASSNLDQSLVNHVTAQPKKHWSLFELPVAHDLESGETHYFRGKSVWGAFLFSDLQRLVGDYIENTIK